MKFLVHIIGGIVVLLLSFRIGLSIHFPIEKAAQYLQWEVQQNTNDNWGLEFEKVSLSGLIGLKGSNVSVLNRTRKSDPFEEKIFLDQVSLNASPLKLLQGRLGLEASTNFLDGELNIQGERKTAEIFNLRVKSSDLNLAMLPIAGSGWSVDLLGMTTININLRHHLTDLKKGDGHLEIAFKDLKLDGGEVMGIELMPITFSDSTIQLDRSGEKLKVKEAQFISDLIEAEITGHIRLNRRIENSRLMLKLKLSLMGDLETVGKMIPMLKNAAQKDGSYLLSINGRLNSPSVQGVNNSSPKGYTPSTTNSSRNKKSNSKDSDEDVAEKKRQKRLDRQKKRLEDRKKRLENAPKRQPNINIDGREVPMRPKMVQIGDDEEIEDEEIEDEEIEDEEIEDEEIDMDQNEDLDYQEDADQFDNDY
ncbi:MAG: type II secretion system protein GspN [Proteobacteria bacterium]|nr:type II secretion system protein GspN [Pseudomonadota bacterium]